MLGKGIIEIEAGGKVRGFKFGTYTIGLVTEIEKIEVIELGNRLNRPNEHLHTLMNFMFAAAKSYCLSKRQEVDFNAVDVADWLDEIGFEKALEIVSVGLQLPNKSAPETPGQEKPTSSQ